MPDYGSTFSGRSRYFLTAHTLSSIVILGSGLLATIIFVQTDPDGHNLSPVISAFDLDYLNTLFLPLLGLSLGLSLLTVRPYHRCECSGGEGPAGNAIV